MKKLSTFVAALVTCAFTNLAQADISYDYIEAGWDFDSIDLPGFDESHGGYIDLSVSLDDNAYITLFGTIADETSSAGFSVGLHHEVAEPVDLIAEVGGLYRDVNEDFGAFGEFGARWEVAKFLELNAAVGLEWLNSETDVYGVLRAIVPIHESFSLVLTGKVREDSQGASAGFRFDF